MELRLLRYFLTVAAEENITHAAEMLHITQPTLSRQIAQLESELGVRLFERKNHRVVLTEEGLVLRRRAREIVELVSITEDEIAHYDTGLEGNIRIGCGETVNVDFISQAICEFRREYTHVTFTIYTAIADDVKDRMNQGLLDFGLLMGPTDVSHFNFIQLPYKEETFVLMLRDDPLATLTCITPKDLAGQPIILAQRESVQNSVRNWLGKYYSQTNVVATINLSRFNSSSLVRTGVGKHITVVGQNDDPALCTIPLRPKLIQQSVLAWKKDANLSRPVQLFAEFVQSLAK